MAFPATSLLDRLNRSVAAACAVLERPKIACSAVVLLLVIHTGLLVYSAYAHSPTLNEPSHLVAGLSYWKLGRFDVYNVNPPMVKLVAALPVIAVGYEGDWSGFYTGLGARPEFGMGEDFVAANGDRSFYLFMIARWACIPFSWVGGIVCYLWSRDLFGRPSGVIASAIWCFEPNILGHASLITSDAAGTALGLAACYTFWRWLKQPTWSQAAITGIVLGLAELAKTTLILFYPLWPLMWLAYRWEDRRRMQRRDWLREAGMLALRMLIGLYVLNFGYGFEGSLKPLGEYRFVSELLTGSADPRTSLGVQRTATETETQRNRFSNSWMRKVHVPFPENYVIGVDLQQRDFESSTRPSYVRGEWHDRGWWWYYLYAASIKAPLGLLLLAALTLVRPAIFSGHWRDIAVLLAPPLVIFGAVSAKSRFSEHLRYALPCFPFVFILASSVASIGRDRVTRHIGNKPKGLTGPFRTASRDVAAITPMLCIAFVVWLISSSLWIYPHSLSYCNELAGGPLRGPDYLLGSNFDWGQDLRYALSAASKASSPCTRLRFVYFGPAPPRNYGIICDDAWLKACHSEPKELLRIADPALAVSCNFLYGYPCTVLRGAELDTSCANNLSEACQQLRLKPNFIPAGYSIRLYGAFSE